MNGENRLRESRDQSVVYEGQKTSLSVHWHAGLLPGVPGFNGTVLVGVRVGVQGIQ